MGPDQNALEEVKQDAIRGTLRHFRHAQEDNGFKPAGPMDFETVRADLLDKREEKETDETKDEASADESPAEKEVSPSRKPRAKKEDSNG